MSATGPSGHAQPLSIEMWFDMHQLLRSCHHRLPICKISSPIWLPLVFSISPVLTCKCGIIHPQPMLTSFFCWALYTRTRLWCLGWWWVPLLGVGCPTERLLSPRRHDLCMTLRNFAHETPVICCNPNALQSAKIQVSSNCIKLNIYVGWRNMLKRQTVLVIFLYIAFPHITLPRGALHSCEISKQHPATNPPPTVVGGHLAQRGQKPGGK